MIFDDRKLGKATILNPLGSWVAHPRTLNLRWKPLVTIFFDVVILYYHEKPKTGFFFNTRHAEIHMALSPCSPSSAIFLGIQSPSPRIPVGRHCRLLHRNPSESRTRSLFRPQEDPDVQKLLSLVLKMIVIISHGQEIPKLVSGRIFFGLIPAMFDWRLIQSPPKVPPLCGKNRKLPSGKLT